MQTWSGPNAGGTNSPSRNLTTYILLFFSLAGLIAGFAFGGFFHPGSNTIANNIGPTTAQTPTQTPSDVTPTPTVQPVVPLGLPQFKPFPTTNESATNSAPYTVGTQVVDKQDQPVHASDITCKVWLVQQIPDKQALSIDTNILKAVSNLSSPISGTVNNQPAPEVIGLTFDPGTPQTGFCNPNGQMTWKYTIAPSLQPGTYDIVILTDWKGTHWNWSWVNIMVK
jgi:hypothetical protein